MKSLFQPYNMVALLGASVIVLLLVYCSSSMLGVGGIRSETLYTILYVLAFIVFYVALLSAIVLLYLGIKKIISRLKA